MWFKCKPKNKRLKREHLLEVKASSHQRRQARWRWCMASLGFSTGLALILAIFWFGGAWMVDRLVYQNEAFATKNILIQTDGVIPDDMIRRWAGVKNGDNLLALDLDAIRRNLELVPLIKEAAVERVLPQTLKLRVAEREPMVQVHALQPRSSDDGYDVVVYYLDEEGCVMARPESWFPGAKAWRAVDSLPILCGLDGSELHPGWKVESRRVKAGLELINRFIDSPVYGCVDLVRVDISAPEVIRVSTLQGAEVTLAPDRYDWQLRRWRCIYDLGYKQGKALASLDLSITNNLPARWVEANSVPPVIPKSGKKPRHLRKNV